MASTEMDPREVITACDRALEKIKKRREEALEHFIQKRMSRWFFPSRSREDAITRLKNDSSFFSTYDKIMWISGGQEADALAIKRAASAALEQGTRVRVSGRDLGVIGPVVDTAGDVT